MKVLSLLTYYHPHWTGLTAHAEQLARGLARRGHEVSVLAHRHDAALPAEEVCDGVRVHRVTPVARVSRGMISPAYVSKAWRLARRHDLMLVNTPMLEALPVTVAAVASGRPVVVVHHGDLVMPAGAAHRLVEHCTVASMIGAARLAAAVTTYSDDYGESSDFLLPFRPKLEAISPPVEIPRPRRPGSRDGFGPPGAKLIGFAGRFVEEKGGDVLLRALSWVLAAEPEAHLVIAGDTNVVYESFFERCRPLYDAVADRVTLAGLIRDRQELADFYAACEVLALPSRTDCFALVQAEAMLCGTPVVASDIAGARVAVRRTGMGLLVRPEDPQSLADGLIRVLRDRQRYVRPRAEVAEVFDAERTVEQYERLLDGVRRRRKSFPSLQAPARAAPPCGAFGEADRRRLQRMLGGEADMAYRRRMPILLEYLELDDGDRLLDGGCGMGGGLRVATGLRRLEATGVDREVARLDWARDAELAASLVAAEVAALPFAAASFDKALLSEVLEHVDDDVAVLREIDRVLRPGGIVAISVPHANYPWLWDPLGRSWHALGGRPIRTAQPAGIWSLHRRLYWPGDLVRRVEQAGLIVEQVEAATHFSFPFAHFLVYGIGKPLLERGLLPRRWRDEADRLRRGRRAPASVDPLRWATAVLAAVDRRNDGPAVAGARTFVNVLVKARKPAR